MNTRAQEECRRIMQLVGSKDIKPELVVRRQLHGIGHRYRLAPSGKLDSMAIRDYHC